jgi:phthalate 4,5-cis-dihydrodiol dehydrogenase
VKGSTSEQCRVAVVGLGTAGRLMAGAIAAHPGMKLSAVVDPVAAVREEVARKWDTKALPDIERAVAEPDIDAIYIATPTPLHAEHTLLAAAAGKHVLCEKPMAASLDEALSMVQAAERAGVVLMIGHSRSYEAPYAKMREIIDGGSLGTVRMVQQIAFTDWMYRPRRPDELDPRHGGGVTYRQGAHQFDVIRLLAGGRATAVHATTFDWAADRPGVGAHTVTIRFEDGAIGNAIYSGYGTFSSAELAEGVDEAGFIEDPTQIGSRRRQFAQRTDRDETAAKIERSARADRGKAPYHGAFGLTLVNCERGDLRQSPAGVFVYSSSGRVEVPVSLALRPRDMVVAEFHDAVLGKRRPVHDGRWGLANLEICVAATEAAASRREVPLVHQVDVGIN